MSTRSLIGIQTENGIEAVYCHWDGQPDHHLPILTGHYATDAAVARLLALGDLSILGPERGRKHDFRTHSENPKAKGWCLAYGRDRGDKKTARETYASEEKFLDRAHERWADYVYLFRDGRWLYRDARKGEEWREANA